MGSWWIDEEPYPGPTRELDLKLASAQIRDALAVGGTPMMDAINKLIAAFEVPPAILGHQHGGKMALQKAMKDLADHIAAGDLECREAKPCAISPIDQLMADKRKKNHGPIPSHTFDRRGLKRY